MAELVNYTPPAHMDAKALLVRAARLLGEWERKYGEHQPDWLPPADQVRWREDAAAYIAAHEWQQPAFVPPGVQGRQRAKPVKFRMQWGPGETEYASWFPAGVSVPAGNVFPAHTPLDPGKAG